MLFDGVTLCEGVIEGVVEDVTDGVGVILLVGVGVIVLVGVGDGDGFRYISFVALKFCNT